MVDKWLQACSWYFYDGLVYSKFIEAFDKVPLGAVCHDTVMFMSSALYYLSGAVFSCRTFSSFGRRAMRRKAPGARTRFGSGVFGYAFIIDR
jgi:hypothetical protein